MFPKYFNSWGQHWDVHILVGSCRLRALMTHSAEGPAVDAWPWDPEFLLVGKFWQAWTVLHNRQTIWPRPHSEMTKKKVEVRMAPLEQIKQEVLSKKHLVEHLIFPEWFLVLYFAEGQGLGYERPGHSWSLSLSGPVPSFPQGPVPRTGSEFSQIIHITGPWNLWP